MILFRVSESRDGCGTSMPGPLPKETPPRIPAAHWLYSSDWDSWGEVRTREDELRMRANTAREIQYNVSVCETKQKEQSIEKMKETVCAGADFPKTDCSHLTLVKVCLFW